MSTVVKLILTNCGRSILVNCFSFQLFSCRSISCMKVVVQSQKRVHMKRNTVNSVQLKPFFLLNYTKAAFACFYLGIQCILLSKQNELYFNVKAHFIFQFQFQPLRIPAAEKSGGCELTLLTKSTHPAFETGAGVWPLAHSSILALQPTHG